MQADCPSNDPTPKRRLKALRNEASSACNCRAGVVTVGIEGCSIGVMMPRTPST